MAHHDHVVIDTKKEVLQALVGVVLFLAMVAFIGISAFLRPAGDHVDVQALNAQASAVSETNATATATTADTASATASVPSVASTVETAVTQETASVVASATAN